MVFVNSTNKDFRLGSIEVKENLDEIMALVNGEELNSYGIGGSTFRDPEPEEVEFKYKVGDVVIADGGQICTLTSGPRSSEQHGGTWYDCGDNSLIFEHNILGYAPRELK